MTENKTFMEENKMIQLALAILTFFIVEWIYLATIYNLEAGFLPAIGAGIVVAVITTVALTYLDNKKDNPPPDHYLLSRAQVLGVIKRVLKTYHFGYQKWRINYDDKNTGELQASIHFVDDSYRDHKWLVPSGRIDKTIVLYVQITSAPDRLIAVQLSFDVDSPLSRADANRIINEVTCDIHNDLLAAQEARRNTRAKAKRG